MQTRRAQKVSILIVPEDDAEPYSFRISTNMVKLLYVVGAVLIVHIVVGAIFYWKYAGLYSYNKQVLAYNSQLQKDNKRVIALADQFYALENEYKKVKGLLGVDLESSQQMAGVGGRQNLVSSQLFENIVPTVQISRESPLDVKADNKQFFLSPKKNKIHNFAESLPTLLPVKGFLTLDFQKEGWFQPKTHSGIDIVAKKGTLIRASGAGVVIFAGWTYDLGNLIIIDHGGGILSYYGHNQRLLKSEKIYVKKGEPIALLGTSGKSSGPHLHFEIWKDGLPVDPREFILAFNETISTN
ncbi:M23 family metallopeptidase [candidate division KSB1 bacterium]|nr:M23 family metallopeptidase [candidate division KSB1 bacterium]